MHDRDFTLTLTFDESPEDVFAAVTNVRGWWSEGLEGRSAAAGDEFTYRHGELHRSTHRVTEAVPGRRVVWQTLDAELTHAKRPAEWTGTIIRFELEPKGAGTALRFTHQGLVPALDCFDACSRGWSHYVGESLRQLVTTGEGQPDPAALGRPEHGRADRR